MLRSLLWLPLLSAALLSGCNTINSVFQKTPPKGMVAFGQHGLGAGTCFKNGHAEVMGIIPGSPAEKSGVKPGDYLAKCFGQDVSTLPMYLAYRRAVERSPNLEYVCQYYSPATKKTISVSARSAPLYQVPSFSIFEYLSGLAACGNKIRLLPVTTPFAGSFPPNTPPITAAQERAIMDSVIATYTKLMTHEDALCGGDIKFLERSRLDDILGELKLQSSGAINPKEAKRIGQLAGATHALIVGTYRDVTNDGVRWKMTDTQSLRLVELETGTVVESAVDVFERAPN